VHGDLQVHQVSQRTAQAAHAEKWFARDSVDPNRLEPAMQAQALNTPAVSRMSCWLRPRDMIKRMDNVGIVVDDPKAAIAFFVELGLELESETAVEGSWVDRCVGLDGVRSDIAMLRTPEGHGGLELIKFHAPRATTAEPNAPVNTLGIRRIMFAVDDIDDVRARLRDYGGELIGEVVQYEDKYRLCYLRGPEGIIVALAQEIGEGGA
jgi:catechol 2,3-dioxygenase-like lactoylglutathione lyase family enzyme